MIKGITRAGELVDIGEPGVVAHIDTDEPGHEKTIESYKRQFKRDNPGAVAVEAVAEMKGVAPVGVTANNAADGGADDAAETTADGIADSTANATAGAASEGESAPPPMSDSEQALVDEFGDKVASALIEVGYSSREAVEKADDATLLAIRGIGTAALKKIRGKSDDA
jgi:hypothetical protein